MTWTPTSKFAPAAEPSVWERIEAVYGKPFAELKAPEGYRFRMRANGEPEFYPPVCGQRWMGGRLCAVVGPVGYDWDSPRLILEPIPAPTPKRYVIVLEETGEVRFPKAGELFVSDNGLPGVADRDWIVLKRPILRVVSREAV